MPTPWPKPRPLITQVAADAEPAAASVQETAAVASTETRIDLVLRDRIPWLATTEPRSSRASTALPASLPDSNHGVRLAWLVHPRVAKTTRTIGGRDERRNPGAERRRRGREAALH